jgi:hypothetical protein
MAWLTKQKYSTMQLLLIQAISQTHSTHNHFKSTKLKFPEKQNSITMTMKNVTSAIITHNNNPQNIETK